MTKNTIHRTLTALFCGLMLALTGCITHAPVPTAPAPTPAEIVQQAFADADESAEKFRIARDAAFNIQLRFPERREWAEKAIDLAWDQPGLGGWEDFQRLCQIAGGRFAMIPVAIREITKITD